MDQRQSRVSQAANKVIGYDSGETLMAKGPDVLFDALATKLEPALGRPVPQLEVRFANVNLSAEITVVEKDPTKVELPTLLNATRKAFAGPKKRVVRKEILRDVSGVFRPGVLTLVLGQPGSGKSSLMKLLSARFPMTKNVKLDGDITYNGVDRSEVEKVLPQFAAYVAQRDKHYASLTVKETFNFARDCINGELSRRGDELLAHGTDEENADALRATRALFAHYPDVVIRELGLQICQDTVVGDTMLRGISGGERKRTTVGEMEFGLKYASFLDEISTGLDSAAAYDIVDAQRSIAHRLKKTVVIALLQPPPEVFGLFDDVLLMNDGVIIYHGPVGKVLDYFEKLGFTCPPERATADFLLDLCSDEQLRYQKSLENPSIRFPRLASEFAAHFRESDIHQATLNGLQTPLEPHLIDTAELNMKLMPEFSQSFLASTWTVFHRQLLVTYRQHAFIFGRFLMIFLNSFLFCTVFADFDPTDVAVVLGVVFMAVMFMSMGQAALIPTYMAQREVFYKQRGANFYRSSSYVLATSVCQIPMALAEAIIFGSLLYWICGFEADAGRYIIFEVVLILANLAMGMWFFFLTTVSPNSNVAMPFGMVSVMFFTVFAGFIVTKSQIPDYLIWIYWLSPLSWGMKALSINQYRADTFNVCVYGDVDYCTEYGIKMGEYYLQLYDVATETEWVAYGIIYLAAIYVLFMAMSAFVLEYIRYEAPENVDVSKEIAKENGDSYCLAQTPKNAQGAHDDIAVSVDTHQRNFTPVTIAFEDLWYSVPDPADNKKSLELLKGISGFARPGTMTALMGSTGAGKTTLMDVIAGRKTAGTISGRLLLNGYPASPLAIQRCTGYCEQADIHCDATTIREALTFSAFLRQDSQIPDSVKFDSVNEAIELLGFEDTADQIVRGSSVEQMKRLTIGVELAAQPSVLFLDEPTSGLDARSAKLIMDGVRRVANSGRTIVCTIHQPSAEVFYLFDSLLLLKRGGQTVFFGELGYGCRNLIEYFEAVPGTMPLPEGYNPATWMLECIGAGVNTATAHDVDFVQLYKMSEFQAALDDMLIKDGVGQPASNVAEVVYSKKRAADWRTQMAFVVRRFMDMYWRTPSYNLTRVIIAVLLALLFGLIFVGSDYDSYQGLNSGVGMVFTAAMFNAMISYQSVLPLTVAERASYYRERAAQTYNAFWYWVGSTLAEIPYVFGSSAIFTIIFYPMVGFTDVEAGFLFWVGQSLMVLMQVYMGELFCYALPTEEVAAVIGVLINMIFIMFMGFMPPASAIPDAYTWLYDISPHRYALSIMVSLIFADCDDPPTWNETLGAYEDDGGSALGCKPMRNAPVTVGHTTLKEYTEGNFGMKHDDIPRNFGIVLAYIVIFRLLGLVALRYINHQKK